MQELVEIIRRDHAAFHDLARDDDDGLGRALQDHLAFLDGCVAPAIEGLGPLARTEWAVAREGLIDARELAERPGRSTEVAEALAGHAEQMEQIVCRGWSAS